MVTLTVDPGAAFATASAMLVRLMSVPLVVPFHSQAPSYDWLTKMVEALGNGPQSPNGLSRPYVIRSKYAFPIPFTQ